MSFLGQRVFAILRAADASRVADVIETLAANGLGAVEITVTTEGVHEAIDAARQRYGERLWVGAGTVLDAVAAEKAIAAGAQFCVSPIVDESMVEACVRLGVPAVPGAATPTEMVRAARLGASAVKVFPKTPGGHETIRQILAPLPWLKLVPTGGVTIDQVPDYLEAGAVAVGLGSPLIRDALTGGSLDALAERVRTLLTLVA